MNVLFLNNYFYMRGGSERVFFGDMEMVEAHGHRVAPFCRRSEGDFASPFARFFAPDLQTATVSASLDGLRTVGQVISSRETAAGLDRMLAEFTPDVAHAHNIYGRLTTSVLALLRQRGIPVMMTLHDYKLVCPSYKLEVDGRVCEACGGKQFYRAVVRRCHKGSMAASAVYAAESYFNRFLGRYRKGVAVLISPSHFLKGKLVEFGWPETQIEVVRNCLDSSGFEPRYEPGEYFLYLGRLSREKGVDILLDAFATLPDTARLVVAGTGPLEAELRGRVAGEGRVTFTGYLSGAALEASIRGARAVVVPSQWYENAPLSVLEAMAYGKPVIGARIGGIPEMVEEGRTGLLFEAGDVDALREALDRLLTMSDAAVAEMGRAARRRVEEHYTAEEHYERLMAVYERAIGRR